MHAVDVCLVVSKKYKPIEKENTNMKKHIYTVVAFAVFAASALANSGTALEVKVPFAFKAGDSTLPAGTYRVTETTSGVLLFRGDKDAVFVPKSIFETGVEDSGKASFKFAVTGDKYILREVHPEK
jgi:hypothetical protein